MHEHSRVNPKVRERGQMVDGQQVGKDGWAAGGKDGWAAGGK